MVANTGAGVSRELFRHFPDNGRVAIGPTERRHAAFRVGRHMSKVVNLNKFRKQKAKQTRVKQADTNRRLHGRTKAERAQDALQKQKLESTIERTRLEHRPKSDDDSSPPAPAPADGLVCLQVTNLALLPSAETGWEGSVHLQCSCVEASATSNGCDDACRFTQTGVALNTVATTLLTAAATVTGSAPVEVVSTPNFAQNQQAP
jgi:hypothetical protein